MKQMKQMNRVARVVDGLVAWVAPRSVAQAQTCPHGDITVEEFCYCSANLQHSFWRLHTTYGGIYCNDQVWTSCYIVHNGCFF